MGRGIFSIKFKQKLIGIAFIAVIIYTFSCFYCRTPDKQLSVTQNNPPIINVSVTQTNSDDQPVPKKIVAEKKVTAKKNETSEVLVSNKSEDIKNVEFVDTLKPGDSIGKLLLRNGISISESFKVVSLLGKALNLKRIRTGQQIFINAIKTGEAIKLKKLSIEEDGFSDSVEVFRVGDTDCFQLRKNACNLVRDDICVRGVVVNNLSADILNKRVPSKIVSKVIHVLNNRIDFRRDVKPGDRFEIVYEVIKVKDKDIKRPGNLKYVNLISKRKNVKIYGMSSVNSIYDYFDTDGVSVIRNVMRMPIDGGRISSRFGARMHPVRGYTCKHKGVDIAASIGTPIHAASKGRVKFIGIRPGYGRVICLSHVGGYLTLYAHMSRFARGIQVGSHVVQGQVIGFVGRSGETTGSHVHVEVIKGGVNLNPLRVGMLPKNKLSGNDLLRFKKLKSSIEAILQKSI